MKKIILGWWLIVLSSFGNIVIKDEVGLLSKEFIKQYESQYKGKNKEIHVLIKKTIGDENPAVYGANYFREEDLGKSKGSGIVILHVIDKRWVQAIVGYKVEDKFTDLEIVNSITKPMASKFKINKIEDGYKIGIESAIKILDEVIK